MSQKWLDKPLDPTTLGQFPKRTKLHLRCFFLALPREAMNRRGLQPSPLDTARDWFTQRLEPKGLESAHRGQGERFGSFRFYAEVNRMKKTTRGCARKTFIQLWLGHTPFWNKQHTHQIKSIFCWTSGGCPSSKALPSSARLIHKSLGKSLRSTPRHVQGVGVPFGKTDGPGR